MIRITHPFSVMIKPILYCFGGFLFAVFLNACNSDCHDKGNCDPEYYRYDLGEARNYLWADTGSYWIYKNSKTGELDTQTCIGAITYWVTAHGTTKYAKHITVDYEVLYRRIFSTYNQWTYIENTSFYNPNAMRTQQCFLDRSVSGEGVCNPFFFPAVVNEKGGISNTITTCTNIDTSLVVNGQNYDHVVVFDINIDQIWYPNSYPLVDKYPNVKYLWVRNIGLVKRINLKENYSWDLIDYKIIP